MREYFSLQEAGMRAGVVVGATLLGMALGGWMPGTIFDLTGSYRATFVNGVLWNLLNHQSCSGCCHEPRGGAWPTHGASDRVSTFSDSNPQTTRPANPRLQMFEIDHTCSIRKNEARKTAPRRQVA